MSIVKRTDSYDALAEDLRALRHAAGSPSFTEIAVRVGQVREARGTDPARSRPARTTAYGTFRAGRSRMDGALVADIAEALDAPDPQSWRDRCGRIQHALEESRLRSAASEDVDDEPTEDPTQDTEADAGAGAVPAPEPSASGGSALDEVTARSGRALDSPQLLLQLLHLVTKPRGYLELQ